MDAADFLLDDAPLPPAVLARARLCLIDLVGVGWGAADLPLSRIVRGFVADAMPGPVPVPFGTGTTSAMGAALAAGMTIDALDGHDGCNLTKGHAGCGLLAGLLALAPDDLPGAAILDLLARGYEVATRAGITQHAACADYHTSGAWVAVAVAGLGVRLLGGGRAQVAEAMGIAEYHGPRSQMMRCIDHPTMVKDGSGQGAMVGVQAALMAIRGFTGGPALTIQGPAWADLGRRWLIFEQYFKPYPVCRWAQAPVEAVLSVRPRLDGPVEEVVVETFAESIRLAVTTPRTIEEAQYSTAFPVAVALARGRLTATDLSGPALGDAEIRRLAGLIRFVRSAEADALFPETRIARVRVRAGGGVVESDWCRPRWDADAPPGEADLVAKFAALTAALPTDRRAAILDVLRAPARMGDLRRAVTATVAAPALGSRP